MAVTKEPLDLGTGRVGFATEHEFYEVLKLYI
jgi:hypothetical protein